MIQKGCLFSFSQNKQVCEKGFLPGLIRHYGAWRYEGA